MRYSLKYRVSALILIWSLMTSAYCQEAKVGPYVIDNFSGGLNTKYNPHALDKSEATEAENVRFDLVLGGLSKRVEHRLFGTADASNAITGMHRLYMTDGTKKAIVNHSTAVESADDGTGAFTSLLTVSTSGQKWQWLTWHDLAIGMDGYNQPVKSNGTDTTYLGACFAEDAGSGAGPNGTYSYKVTFYTASYEVLIGPASPTVTVTDNDISLSMIPIGPDTYTGEAVIGRKVYRIENGGTTYKLLTNGTIANNTAVTLTDSDADAALGATISPTATTIPPTGRFSCVNNNRLFIANDATNSHTSRVYYSDSGSHDWFPDTNYQDIRLSDGDEITFIKNFLGRLCIGKDNSIQYYFTDGDDPANDWEVSDPMGEGIGCRAPYTVANSPIGIIYLSSDGLYRFTGQQSFKISDAVSPEIADIGSSNLANCWGVFSGNKYYMVYTSLESGATTNNRMLVYDVLADAYSIDLVSYNALCVFNAGDDNEMVYAGSSTSGAVYSLGETDVGMIHRKHSDFTGTWDDARYIPTSAGGDSESPVIELAWDCTIDGWLAELQGKNAAISTIDDIETYITGATIDRPDGSGSYISQVLDLNPDSFDKIYWHETIPATGGDVTMQVRAGATVAACAAASWSSELTTPTGSDISGVTAARYVQYKINLTSTDSSYTPTVYKTGNYVVKITYNREGTTSEASIPMKWVSGWLDLGYPGHVKVLRRIVTYHSGTSGDLDITFTNFDGETNEFVIDLGDNPSTYSEYFTTGAFSGERFKVQIYNNDLNPLTVNKIILYFGVEDLQT